MARRTAICNVDVARDVDVEIYNAELKIKTFFFSLLSNSF